MIISIIAAVAENSVIGYRGEIPWYLPEDMVKFRKRTMGKRLIMGRKTFEGIIKKLGKPLPGRTSLVLTNNLRYLKIIDEKYGPSARAFLSLSTALKAVPPSENELFIAGGQKVYQLAIPIADKMYITHVHTIAHGDTLFPSFEPRDWIEMMGPIKTDLKSRLDYHFSTYVRKR